MYYHSNYMTFWKRQNSGDNRIGKQQDPTMQHIQYPVIDHNGMKKNIYIYIYSAIYIINTAL